MSSSPYQPVQQQQVAFPVRRHISIFSFSLELLFIIIALATTYWETDDYNNHMGLWKDCGGSFCASFNSNPSSCQGSSKYCKEFYGTRGCAVLTFLFLTFALFCYIQNTYRGGSETTHKAGNVFALLSFLFGVITCSLFIDFASGNTGDGTALGWSFYLFLAAIVGMVFAILRINDYRCSKIFLLTSGNNNNGAYYPNQAYPQQAAYPSNPYNPYNPLQQQPPANYAPPPFQPNYQPNNQPNYQQPNYQQPYQQPNYQQPNYQQPNYPSN